MIYLHPTMYLLILSRNLILLLSKYKFTSHYVSINSRICFFQAKCHFHLHPTMYLLIPNSHLNIISPVKNLHPTMYLLIRCSLTEAIIKCIHLHPTMYLLIPYTTSRTCSINLIYIPLCIY